MGDLHFSTYLGGELLEWTPHIISGENETVIVAGNTESEDFPANEGKFGSQFIGMSMPHVTVFNSLGEYQWSTFLGGGDYGDILSLDMSEDSTIATPWEV